MPLPKKVVRVTLEEIGAPELFVEFKSIVGMSWEEFQGTFPKSAIEKIKKEDDEHLAKMFGKLVVDWNIPEEDGGEVLPLPKDDSKSVMKLPVHYVSFLAEAFWNAVTEVGKDINLP